MIRIVGWIGATYCGALLVTFLLVCFAPDITDGAIDLGI